MMYRVSYRELLNIKEKFSGGLIDNYYLCLTVYPEEAYNPAWQEFVNFMREVKPECVYKVANILPEGKFDNVRIDSHYDGFLPNEYIPKFISLLDKVCESLPSEKDCIHFEWNSTFFDY